MRYWMHPLKKISYNLDILYKLYINISRFQYENWNKIDYIEISIRKIIAD